MKGPPIVMAPPITPNPKIKPIIEAISTQFLLPVSVLSEEL
jgi:hypothetical protein